MPQTSVNSIGQPAAFAGLIADSAEVVDRVSAVNAEASANIGFGIGVIQGTAKQDAKLATASTDTFKGVSAFSMEHAPGTYGDLDANGGGYLAGAKFNVLRKGRIWVQIDQSITSIAPFKDRGYCRYAANGSNTTIGAFSNASDNAKNLDLTAVVVFTSDVTTAADGKKIAQIEVDFTNKP